jgi:hypothetical protein
MVQVSSIKLPAFAEHVGIEILQLDKDRVVAQRSIRTPHVHDSSSISAA